MFGQKLPKTATVQGKKGGNMGRGEVVMTNAGEVCILITSIFLSVVLLRACWMQGSEKCMEDGDATVCTCNADLCNSARPAHGLSRPLAGLGLGGLGHGPAFLAIMLTILHVILTAAATPTQCVNLMFSWQVCVHATTKIHLKSNF